MGFVKRNFLAFASLVILLNLTFFAYQEAKERADQRRAQLFEIRTTQVKSDIERRIGHYIQILKGGKGLFAVSDSVYREEWKRYYNIISVGKNYPGIQGLGYAVYLRDGGKKAHEERVQADGFPDYQVLPEGIRAEYTPVAYLEPFEARNLRAFGYDMFSDSTRRQAMEIARDTKLPTISGKVTLVQETRKDPQAGFNIYLPVYDASQEPETVEERRRLLKGFVYAPFRAGDLLTSILGDEFPDINVEVYDGTEITMESLLYSSTPNLHYFLPYDEDELKKLTILSINDHIWNIYISSLPEFGGENEQPSLLMMGGIMVSFLMFFILLSHSRTKESNQIKQAITDNATAAIFMMNAKGYCTFMNPAAEKMTGYSFDEIKQKPLHDMIHYLRADGSQYPKHECPIDKALPKNDELRAHEDIFIRKGGAFFPVSCSVSPIYSDGMPQATLVEVRDISQEKQDKEELVKQAHILNSMSEGVSLSNEEGIILFTNPAEDAIFGYERGELIRKHVSVQNSYQPEENLKIVNEIIDQLKKKGFWLGELKNIKKDGTHFTSRARINALKMNGRQYWICVQEDITKEKNIQKTIQENAEKLQENNKVLEILNQIGTTISAELELKKLVQSVTDATTQLTGAGFGAFFYNLVDEQGESYTLFALSGDQQEIFSQFPMPRNTAIFSPTFHGEGAVRSDDITQDPRYGKNKPYSGIPEGHPVVRSFLSVPVVSRTGEVLGGLFFGHTKPGVFTANTEALVKGIASQAAIAIDNARLYESSQTDRQKLLLSNEELEKKNQQLLRINNDLDSFVYTASHDLKAPISNIEGLMVLLNKKLAPTSDAQEYQILEHINQSIKKFKTTISDLTDVSKVQKNFDSVLEPVSFHDTLEEVKGDIYNLMKESDAVIITDFQVPSIHYAKGNLRSIIYNLLSNAIKYRAPDRRPQIELCTRIEENYVVLEVQDNGLGIEAAQKHKLFIMFKRIHTHVEGSGVGLYIVKRIVDNNKGKIEVDTEPGKGTHFKIFFKQH